MKTGFLIAALLAPVAAFATETCPDIPRDQWLRPEEVQARLEARGYEVRRIKRDGSCFEVKAKNKEGKRVEAYVSPADAKVIVEKVKDRS